MRQGGTEKGHTDDDRDGDRDDDRDGGSDEGSVGGAEKQSRGCCDYKKIKAKKERKKRSLEGVEYLGTF